MTSYCSETSLLPWSRDFKGGNDHDMFTDKTLNLGGGDFRDEKANKEFLDQPAP